MTAGAPRCAGRGALISPRWVRGAGRPRAPVPTALALSVPAAWRSRFQRDLGIELQRQLGRRGGTLDFRSALMRSRPPTERPCWWSGPRPRDAAASDRRRVTERARERCPGGCSPTSLAIRNAKRDLARSPAVRALCTPTSGRREVAADSRRLPQSR